MKTELTRHKNGSWSAAAANLIYVSNLKLILKLTKCAGLSPWLNVSFPTQAILSPALKSPQAGAQTSIFCAVDESLEGVGDDHLRTFLLGVWRLFCGL